MDQHNPAYWRQRADECRKVAEQLDDTSKKIMLEIAELYERMAILPMQGGSKAPT
jgi:hypothetical protein